MHVHVKCVLTEKPYVGQIDDNISTEIPAFRLNKRLAVKIVHKCISFRASRTCFLSITVVLMIVLSRRRSSTKIWFSALKFQRRDRGLSSRKKKVKTPVRHMIPPNIKKSLFDYCVKHYSTRYIYHFQLGELCSPVNVMA